MKDRVVIITGAGQGLGRAFAMHFAKLGAAVAIAEIMAFNGKRVAQEITNAGGRALFVETNVSSSTSVDSMVECVQNEFGKIDILVNNAGLLSSIQRCPVEEITDEEWDNLMRVNITGAFYCVRAIVPVMREAGWGRIINMSSDTVLSPPGLTYAHYITSKAALVGLTRALARELGPDGITVNAIMPGATETEIDRGDTLRELRSKHVVPRQCIPRQEKPDDLLGAVQFLASNASNFITGQTLPVNGGISFV